jgi:hypothetical protein
MSTANLEPRVETDPVSKSRVVAGSLVNMAGDLLLPTMAYLLLTPTHLPVAIRLTLGGFLLAGKATIGRAGRRASRARLVLASVGAAAACAVTILASVAGASTTESIVAGTAVIAVCTVLLLSADHRQLDTFAVLVLVELAVSVILAVVSSDPRFVLARPAAYTAVAGIYALATVRTKPFMIAVTRPFASGGNPARAEAFDRAWDESAKFRKAERLMTALLGIMLLAEAALRVILVYSEPEQAVLKASLVSQLPALALFILWFVIARFAIVPVASKEVDALMNRTDH